MKNFITTLENFAHVPSGTIYRGNGQYDFYKDDLPDANVTKKKRKEVKEDGTVIFSDTTVVSTAERKKAGTTIANPPKVKVIKPERQAIIDARLATLTQNVTDTLANIAVTQGQLDSIAAAIVVDETNLAAAQTNVATKQATLATRTTQLATKQSALDADPTNVTKQAALATAQTNYNTAQSNLNDAQTALATRQQNLADDQATQATRQATMATRQANLVTHQAALAAFKLKRGIV